jgi:hypothetical protein
LPKIFQEIRPKDAQTINELVERKFKFYGSAQTIRMMKYAKFIKEFGLIIKMSAIHQHSFYLESIQFLSTPH